MLIIVIRSVSIAVLSNFRLITKSLFRLPSSKTTSSEVTSIRNESAISCLICSSFIQILRYCYQNQMFLTTSHTEYCNTRGLFYPKQLNHDQILDEGIY